MVWGNPKAHILPNSRFVGSSECNEETTEERRGAEELWYGFYLSVQRHLTHKNRTWDSLELDLEMIGRHLTWVVGTEPMMSSTWVASCFSHWVIFPTPMDRFLTIFLYHFLRHCAFIFFFKVLFGSSGQKAVGFWCVETLCWLSEGLRSCQEQLALSPSETRAEAQGGRTGSPLLVLHFFLRTSVIFVGAVSRIRSVMVSVSGAAFMLYTNQTMFLIISAF